nr:DMT family transporter [Maliibacterium massiliense]
MNKSFYTYLSALLLFGANGIIASLIDLNSLQIVLLRTLLGSLLLVALFFISGGKPTFYKKKKQFAYLCISGVAMGASWMLLYEAYARIGVGIASLSYYCGPVIVMALSPLLFKEPLRANKVVGFAAVLAGVVLINGNAFDGSGDGFGIVCGLLSAVMYACMVICNKKAADIAGLENATLQLLIAFLTTAVFVGVKQGYAMQITPQSILPVLLLGLLHTGIGCYLYFSSIGKLKVQTVALCGYVEPLSAVLFSMLFLKETMLPLQMIGAVLIIGGAMYGELAKKRQPQ